MNWYKGNIHTHTDQSDGDASPEHVVGWFQDHGYDFLVLSDHNHLTILDHGKTQPDFPLMIPGEEVTVSVHQGRKPVHLIAVGIARMVEPIDADDVVPTLQANIDAILDAGGIASIAHPNYKWSFDYKSIIQVNGAALMEIFNPTHTNDLGGPGKYSSEENWDGVLSSGKSIWGVAVDDSHNYNDFTPELNNPGQGWIVVRARDLSVNAIMDSLVKGDFYASTGIMLEELEVTSQSLSLRIEAKEHWLYTVQFIGHGGKIFAQNVGPEASYKFRGDESYIRATITCSNPFKAWTQPVFIS